MITTSIKTKRKGYLITTKYVDDIIEDISSPAREIVFKITQSLTSAPVVSIVRNSTGQTVTINNTQRTAVGDYRINLIESVITGNVELQYSAIYSNVDTLDSMVYTYFEIVNAFTIRFTTGGLGAKGDNFLSSPYYLTVKLY